MMCDTIAILLSQPPVRLGKSGLKVSKIILGCMSYGTDQWQPWVLGEEEGIAQIKFAYVADASHDL
jgi:aryl-alcohol dehydrogenase-like predicted oxidoreductase